MFKWFGSRYFWGGLFIIIGVIFLLQYFGFVDFSSILLSLLFALGGLVFLSVFISDRAQWWALIPGFALLSIAVIVGLDKLLPDLYGEVGGVIFLAGVGLSFILVYLVERQNWWAIIPGGVLLSLATIVGAEAVFEGTTTAGLFFLGLGITFGVLALIPTPQGRMQWAWIPSGILTIMGMVLLIVSDSIFRIVGAVALIILGGYLIYRTVRRT